MRRFVDNVFFWGAAWGLEEATLGHLLHLLPLNIGWLFWFPLAYLFMHYAYKNTGRISSILYTSALAAAVKLIDLLMPVRIDYVINPAFAILLEGCAVSILYWILQKRPALDRYLLGRALFAALLSELFYIVYILIAPGFVSVIPAVKGIAAFAKMMLHSLVNGFSVFLFLAYAKRFFLAAAKVFRLPETPVFKPSETAQKMFSLSPYFLLALSVLATWAM
ncbi:hypothetical protein SDC9_137417 [bioreactor metagenome]|uniref:Uncharacterized protein n=1 Tax=bioreactor metagenome TaxID=1076179 RepID=A0A645DLT9_9ZZZZ